VAKFRTAILHKDIYRYLLLKEVEPMDTFLMIAQIIIAITLAGVILMQGTSGGLGSAFGGDAGIYRTRRGVEKTLFNMTVILATIFLLLSLITVAVQ
jgi:preprotein translocase subunit SecG